ncbi:MULTISPECIES: NADP-dependent oxidoreductase [Pseudofrankia]|uniref:NADP-dependent oxidoreductase n=1 Tax=Pseudofrankia TaxID=2994363 RepID=UPI0002F2F2B8|nr:MULTISPECIES: NADP-dependent oxidoreductase [Pseudofrankia]OHV33908.1 hypothetical protein BCD49_25660 [Pseudofrankia sp. EUN1h]
MSTTRTSRQVLLAHRPQGTPVPADFRLVEVDVPPLTEGQVLVRNTYLALSAAMRTLMSDEDVPLPMYRVGEVLHGPALGEVVASTDPGFAPGDLVRHRSGWREHAWGPASGFLRLDPDLYPDPVAHLSSGLTAYAGLIAAGRLAAGETVLVTSAAGSVGSVAGQLARLLGAGRVIGTVGSAAKADYATGVLGYDQALDYRRGPIGDALGAAAPDGVDVVFDNVGGAQLRAAVHAARPRARIVICGALAHQAAHEPASLTVDTMAVAGKRLTVTGFTAADHPGLAAEWPARFAAWLRDGSMHLAHTRLDGLDSAVPGLLDLLAGRHTGLVVVDLRNAYH